MVNRSKVGKHQLQHKMISSETWRRFSVSRNSSEFHHRVFFAFQEFIRKILRVDAEVERMCSAVQGALPCLRNCKPHRETIYHFWISHEILMMSRHASRSCIPAALAAVIANREVLPQPKNDFGRTPWTNSSQPLIPIEFFMRETTSLPQRRYFLWRLLVKFGNPRRTKTVSIWAVIHVWDQVGYLCNKAFSENTTLKQRYAIFSIRPVKSMKRDEMSRLDTIDIPLN